ncbi:MAG: preprotein translocase subunit YajC [Pyrinomonadaceae bacterium]
MTLINLLFFQGAGGIGPLITQLAPFALIFVAFYFLLIRPQQKKQRDLKAMIGDLKAGDKIVTSSGIIATIAAVKEKSLVIRSAEKTMLEISRASVAGLYDEVK